MRKIKKDIRHVGFNLLVREKEGEKFKVVAKSFDSRSAVHVYIEKNKITKPYRIQGVRVDYTNEHEGFAFHSGPRND